MQQPTARMISRRSFVASCAGLAAASVADLGAAQQAAADRQAGAKPLRPRVAALNSVYRYKSHAYHIAGRFIHGYTREGFHHQPPFQLVRMFNHQQPADDLGRAVCERHGIELAGSIEAALGGKSGLDVDAILLIAEHGDYPLNDRGQILYPRYEWYERVIDIFRASGKSVPVFVDKHLSYDHVHAAEMVAQSREMGFGLMAGSSLPVTWRKPELEPPLETPFTEGLVLYGYDRGTAEIYLIHALESLQCMLERRKGGETGVRQVTCLAGDAVWQAGESGVWSRRLMRAAAGRSPSYNIADPQENVTRPMAILIDYLDGTKGSVLNLPEQLSDFNFAGTVQGRDDPISTSFFLPPPPGARFFDPLVANIEKLFATNQAPYPIERTLLTTTILDLALHSLADGGRPIESPALAIRYQAPPDSGFARGRFTDAD